jgi:hypothetical protein
VWQALLQSMRKGSLPGLCVEGAQTGGICKYLTASPIVKDGGEWSPAVPTSSARHTAFLLIKIGAALDSGSERA